MPHDFLVAVPLLPELGERRDVTAPNLRMLLLQVGNNRVLGGAFAVLAVDESLTVVVLDLEGLRRGSRGDLHHALSRLVFVSRGRTAATALPLARYRAPLRQTSCSAFSSGMFSLRISASSRKPFAPAYLPASPSLLCQNVLPSLYFSE